MIVVNPLHGYYRPEHLAHVMQEMIRRGPPVLRAYFDGELWHAREGTHRLRAAKALGFAPILIPVVWTKGAHALRRARHATSRFGHSFDRVVVVREETL